MHFLEETWIVAQFMIFCNWKIPRRQIFMVSFWFQGELVFHAQGDRASYKLFQTFFESLNHSRMKIILSLEIAENICKSLSLSFTYLTVHCVFCSCALVGYSMIYKRNYTAHTWGVFLRCACVCVFSDQKLKCKNSGTDHRWKVFLLNMSEYVSWGY